MLYCASAQANDMQLMTCLDFTSDMQKQAAESAKGKTMGGDGLSVNIVALGSYLATTGKKFSDLTTKEFESIYVNLKAACEESPETPAIDVAVLSGKGITKTSLDAAPPETATPLTITSAEIASGISKNKTELEQEAWWDETMAGKTYKLTGKVTEVEKGTFSGYWVNLNIGRNIMVRCGMSSDWEATVKKIKKGQQFSCIGEVSKTWTSVFGTTFSVDAG